MNNYRLLVSAVAVSIAVFLLCSAAGAGSLLLEWDQITMRAASAWSAGGAYRWVFDHPPLYPLLLALPFKVFGAVPETARAVNALFLLGAGWFAFLTARDLFGLKAGAAAAALFLVSAVVVQGGRSLDSSDTTLLPLVFGGIFHSVLALKKDGRGAAVKLSLFFAAAFWCKVTSTLGLAAGAVLCLAVFRDGEDAALARRLAACSAAGALIFLATWSGLSLPVWGAQSWRTPLLTPFLYFLDGRNADFVSRALFNALRLLFWFSPFLLVLAFRGLPGRGEAPAERLLAVLLLFYFAGYLAVDGTNYGFPRYHAAILPLLCVFAAGALRGGTAAGTGPVAAAVVSSALAALLADPVLIINLELKKFLFYGDQAGLFFAALRLAAFLSLPLAAVLLPYGRRAAVLPMVLAAFVFSGGTVSALRRSGAAFSTGYQYGAEGKEQVVKLLASKLSPGRAVMATPEFDYALRDAGGVFPGWSVWLTEASIREYIARNEPDFIVAGWTTHTLSQLRCLLRSGDVNRLLEKGYSLREVGTYFVWERAGLRSANLN